MNTKILRPVCLETMIGLPKHPCHLRNPWLCLLTEFVCIRVNSWLRGQFGSCRVAAGEQVNVPIDIGPNITRFEGD